MKKEMKIANDVIH